MVFAWRHFVGVVAGTEVMGRGGSEAEGGGVTEFSFITWESTKYRSRKHSYNKIPDQ